MQASILALHLLLLIWTPASLAAPTYGSAPVDKCKNKDLKEPLRKAAAFPIAKEFCEAYLKRYHTTTTTTLTKPASVKTDTVTCPTTVQARATTTTTTRTSVTRSSVTAISTKFTLITKREISTVVEDSTTTTSTQTSTATSYVIITDFPAVEPIPPQLTLAPRARDVDSSLEPRSQKDVFDYCGVAEKYAKDFCECLVKDTRRPITVTKTVTGSPKKTTKTVKTIVTKTPVVTERSATTTTLKTIISTQTTTSTLGTTIITSLTTSTRTVPVQATAVAQRVITKLYQRRYRGTDDFYDRASRNTFLGTRDLETATRQCLQICAAENGEVENENDGFLCRTAFTTCPGVTSSGTCRCARAGGDFQPAAVDKGNVNGASDAYQFNSTISDVTTPAAPAIEPVRIVEARQEPRAVNM